MRALALVLAALMLAAPACKRDPDAELRERQALSRELSMMPVADTHPWVMAMLTAQAADPPTGVEVELGSRATLAGRRGADPIFRAAGEDGRATLAAALRAYEAEHPRPPKLRPIYEPQPAAGERGASWRLYFVDTSEEAGGFVLDERARVRLDEDMGLDYVAIELGEAQREALLALSEGQLGDRVALLVDGDEAVMVPMVAEPIPDGKIVVTPAASEPKARSAAARELLRRLTGT